MERNAPIGRLVCVFRVELRNAPLLPEDGPTTNKLQNVGDNGGCLCATKLSRKRF